MNYFQVGKTVRPVTWAMICDIDWGNPKVDMELGRTVLQELKGRPGLDVHVGFSYKSAALELDVDC